MEWTPAESPKRQEASLPIIHPLPISPRYQAIFSTTSQDSVVLWFVVGDCLVDTQELIVVESQSLPTHP